MARNTDLIQLRNANVKKRYNEITAKNPKWRNDAVIDELVTMFFLAPRTINAILNNEAVYNKTG